MVCWRTYIYKPCNLSREEEYLKVGLTKFWEDIGFGDEVDPFNSKASKKMKCHIKTKLLVESVTKEERHKIFGKGRKLNVIP